MNLQKLMEDNGLYMSRLLSMSKSGYKRNNPDSVCFFNANLITLKEGKFWYGDIDLTKDGLLLKKIANQIGETIYLLKELDCRFHNSHLSTEELIKKSIWDTTKDI
jgi:hypothetical protein